MFSIEWFSPGNGQSDYTVFEETQLESTTLKDARVAAKFLIPQMKGSRSNTIMGYNILRSERQVLEVCLAKDF
jgi:hypothetical protein